MPLIAINLFKAYWKPLVALIAITAWSWYWYDLGRDAIRAEWKADKAAQIMAIQAEKDRLQDEANTKSKELETTLRELKKTKRELQARLSNEIKQNAAAYECPVPMPSVQLYNNSTTKGAVTR